MISMELEEESKRSLAMETEVEKYLRQLTKHREDTNSKLMGKDISNQHIIQYKLVTQFGLSKENSFL